MGRYDYLYPTPGRIRLSWGRGIVDALNELHSWITDGQHDINVHNMHAYYGYFDTRPYAEGRAVLLDGDPIQIADIQTPAKEKITEAINESTVPSKLDTANDLLDRIYGKVASESTLSAFKDSVTNLLDKIYGKVASEETLVQVRDRLLKLSIDEYGNVGVVIAEPIDEYGFVKVSSQRILEDAFTPVSKSIKVSASENSYGVELALYTGGRPNVNIYYRLGGAGDIYIEVSLDGTTWRTLKTISLSSAGEGLEVLSSIAYPYVRVRTPNSGIDVEFEIVASR